MLISRGRPAGSQLVKGWAYWVPGGLGVGLQGLKVSRSQGLKVSRSQGLMVSRSQGLKVSGSQGLRVSGSQG